MIHFLVCRYTKTNDKKSYETVRKTWRSWKQYRGRHFTHPELRVSTLTSYQMPAETTLHLNYLGQSQAARDRSHIRKAVSSAYSQ